MRASILLLLFLAASAAGQANPGDRVWPGMEEGKCGAELRVTTIHGGESLFHPPKTFLVRFETLEIEQGDFPRKAARLDELLLMYKADGVAITDCSDRTQKVDQRILDDNELFIVLTGRGPLKIVQKRESGYVNAIQRIQGLRFSAETASSDP